MLKILIFALGANVATATACAALARAGGHKARAVDATMLTMADRDPADLVITSPEAAEVVKAAYLGNVVVVANSFNPVDFVPERIKAAEAFIRGDSQDMPSFGTPAMTVDAKVPHADEVIAGADSALASDDAADKSPEGPTVDDLKAALTAKGITFRANASRASLQALLDAADKTAE